MEATMLEKLRQKSLPVIQQTLVEIREKLDTMVLTEYIAFVEIHFAALLDLLSQHPVQFVDNDVNKIRHAVLDIFSRLPQLGLSAEYIEDLAGMGIKILADDNEKNALLAVKIIADMNRAFRFKLEHIVQPIVECVHKTYLNTPALIESLSQSIGAENGTEGVEADSNLTSFSSSSSSMVISIAAEDLANSTSEQLASDASQNKMDVDNLQTPVVFSYSGSQTEVICRATESVRVLLEYPVLLLLLFSLYPRVVSKNVVYLAPVMVAMLALSPHVPLDREKDASSLYRNFFFAQVKTLSLITHLVRQNLEAVRPHDANIVNSIMSLLRRCPDDAMSSRKDILTSVRHIISTEFRSNFISMTDELLLDGKILYGKHESLKSTAYNLLAELVSNIKDSLSQSQIFGIALFFVNLICDYKLPIATQLLSARLVFNFVDKIAQLRANDGTLLPAVYDLNIWILRCCVSKFESFRHQIAKKLPVVVSPSSSNVSSLVFVKRSTRTDNQYLFYFPQNENYERDAKHLLKTLIWGTKGLFVQIQSMRMTNQVPSTTITVLHSQYFRWAMECCLLFSVSATAVTSKDAISSDVSEKSNVTSTNDTNAEIKDILEHFVASLSSLPAISFREVLSSNMDFLCEAALTENILLYVINSLLVNKKTSDVSVDVVLAFLTAKLPDLRFVNAGSRRGDDAPSEMPTKIGSINGDGDDSEYAAKMGQRSLILLRLLKFVLAAIQHNTDNEKHLTKRVGFIVIESLRLANSSRNAMNYYYLVRGIFKAIAHCKLDESYKEMAKWIQHLVVGLESLLLRTSNTTMQSSLLELSLILPAKFSSLIPFLPSILRFATKALKVKGELPMLALRTLEFWSENLNPAFLSDAISNAGLTQELLEGIALHLKPNPYMFGFLALRVLGKLGGHTQSLLKFSPQLYDVNPKTNPPQPEGKGCILRINVENQMLEDGDGAHSNALEFDPVILGACEILCCSAEWSSTMDGEGNVFYHAVNSPSQKGTKTFDFAKLSADRSIADGLINGSQAQIEAKRYINETKNVRDVLYADKIKTAFRVVIKGLAHIIGSPSWKHFVGHAAANDAEHKHNSRISRLLEEMIFALIACAGDPVLFDFPCDFMPGFCLHLALFHASCCQNTVVTSARPDIPLSSYVMNETIFRAVADAQPHVHNAGISTLRMWVSSLGKVFGVDRLAQNSIILHLTRKIILAFHDETWCERIGGIRILSVLCDLLPRGWCMEKECDILEAFMASLRNSSNQLLVVNLKGALETARNLVSYSFSEVTSAPVLKLLLRFLVDSSSLVRLAAKATVEGVCLSRGLTTQALFRDLSYDVATLFSAQLATDSYLDEEGIGVVYGMSYCLHEDLLPIPAEIQKWCTLSLFTTLLNISMQDLISKDVMFGQRVLYKDPSGLGNRFPEDCLTHISVFPIIVPHSVTLRLAILCGLSAFFSNVQLMEIIQDNAELITTSIKVILISIHVEWKDVILAAEKALACALNWLLRKARELPSQLLIDNLNNFTSNLDDVSKINVAMLYGLASFLRQPSIDKELRDTSILTLCLRHLENLVAIEPTAYLNTFGGSYLDVVVGLLDVLNTLPVSGFGGDIPVKIISLLAHKFELSIHHPPCVDPQDSPLLGAVCTFFVRFPDETRQLFMGSQHELEFPQVLDILSRILRLKVSGSAALATCLASADGIDVLLTGAFKSYDVSSDSEDREAKRPKIEKDTEDISNLTSVSEQLSPSIHHAIMATELLIEHAPPEIRTKKLQILSVVRQIWGEVILDLTSKSNKALLNTPSRTREDLTSLCKILITFCKSGFCQSEVLLELAHLLCIDIGLVNANFLCEFFLEDVPSLLSAGQVKELIGMYLGLVPDASMSMTWKFQCLRHLILPLTHTILTDKTSLLMPAFADGQLILGIASLWCSCSQPPLSPTSESPFAEDMPDYVMQADSPSSRQSTAIALPAPAVSAAFLRNKPTIATTKASPAVELWAVTMKIEYLKLTSIFLDRADQMTQRTKAHFKKFVRYPWNLMKVEELSSVRLWALTNLCRYASALGNSNTKFASSLYTHVLKTFQTDGKEMFVGSTDDIIPLIARSPPDELIRLMRLTKKFLQDESVHSLNLHHTNILQIILKHPKVFYPFRMLLSSQMLYSVTRLGYNPNSSSDIRQTALGIVEVFMKWEHMKQERVNQNNLEDDYVYKIQKQLLLTQSSPDIYVADPNFLRAAPPVSTSVDDFRLTPQMMSLLISFILRLSVSKETTLSQAKSCVITLKGYLNTFPMTGVKISSWDKMLVAITDAIKAHITAVKADLANPALKKQSVSTTKPNSTLASKNPLPESLMTTALDILATSLDSPEISAQIFIPHLSSLTVFFQPIFNSENSQLQESFCTFIVKVMQMSLKSPSPEFYESGFYRKLKAELELHFRFSSLSLLAPHSALMFSLRVIRDITKVIPSWVDNHGSSMVRLCQRLLNDLVQQSTKVSRQDPPLGFLDDEESASTFNFHPTASISILAESLPPRVVSSNKPNISADSCVEVAGLLELLLNGVRNGFLEQFKQATLQLVSTVIDGCLGQVLPCMVAEFCSTEILTTSSHLTLKEQTQLFTKICGQHDKGLESFSHSYSVRMSALSDHVGNQSITAKLGASNHLNAALSDVCGLGVLGIMTPERTLREKCHDRVFSHWGSHTYERLLVFLASDIPCISHRYWPALLTPLLLHGSTTSASTDFSFLEIPQSERKFAPQDDDDANCLATYNSFSSLLNDLNSQNCRDLKSDICELSLLHIASGDTMWTQLLQQLWTGLDSSKRQELTMAILLNFLRNRPTKRTSWSSSIPGCSTVSATCSLLRATLRLQPRPQIPTEFLCAIAVDHGLCYEALAALNEDKGTEPKKLLDSTLKIFNHLEDRDMTLSHIRKACTRSETDLAASLETFGHLSKAQEILMHLIGQENRLEGEVNYVESNASVALDSEHWQSRWIESAKELSQWPTLSKYARNIGMIDLAVESATVTCDWETLKSLKDSPSYLSSMERGLIKGKMSDIALAVIECRHNDAEKCCFQLSQLTLTHWQTFPDLCRGSIFHKSLLHNFHRMIELRESLPILVNLSTSLPGGQQPDLTQTYQSWRSRMPLTIFSDNSSGNVKHETFPMGALGAPGLLGWESLVTFRGYIREAVQAPSGSRATPSLQMMESAWDSLALAKHARKQFYYASKNNASIARDAIPFSEKTKERQDVFSSVQGKIIQCLSTLHETPESLKEGIRIANGVNTSHFDTDKKSELLRLKAMCEGRLGFAQDAHGSFAQAVQACESSAKSWLSWGKFCFESMRDEEPDKSGKLGQYALSCIMKAAEHDPSSARQHLAFVLRLVQTSEDDRLATELVKLADGVPAWIWLDYLSSLLRLVSQPSSGTAMKCIIQRIARSHPQPVLLHVTALQSVLSGLPASQQRDETIARCSEIVGSVGSVRTVTLVRRFGQELSSDFLSDKLFVFEQALSEIIPLLSTPESLEKPLSDNAKRALDALTRAEHAGAFTSAAHREVWNKFDQDVASCRTASNKLLLRKLIGWASSFEELHKEKRHASLEQNFAQTHLRAISFSLHSLGNPHSRLEIPGQSARAIDDSRARLVLMDRLVSLKDLEGLGKRSCCFLGCDGQTYTFSIFSDPKQIEQRATFVKASLDWAMQQSHECLRRDLSMQSFETTPLPSHVFLQRLTADSRSLSEIVTSRSEYESRELLVKHLDYLESAPGESFLPAYEHMCALLPPVFLHEFLIDSSCSPANLFHLRRSLASELGVQAALQYIAFSSTPTAGQLSFSILDRSVTTAAVAPCLTRQDLSAVSPSSPLRNVAVPWRFTRSITAALSIPLLNGITATSIGCTLDAFSYSSDVIKPLLELYITEHLHDCDPDVDGEESALKVVERSDCASRMIADVKTLAPSFGTLAANVLKSTSFQEPKALSEAIDSKIQQLLGIATLSEHISKYHVDAEPPLLRENEPSIDPS